MSLRFKALMASALGAAVALFILVSGPGKARQNVPAARTQDDLRVRELKRQGKELYRSGQYLQASAAFEKGYQLALRENRSDLAVWFLNNQGSAEYQLFHYRKAIGVYLRAKDLAMSRGSRELLGVLYINISSLYEQMGETDASFESAQEGLRVLGSQIPGFRSKLLIELALIQSRRKHWDEGVRELYEAIEVSQRELDLGAESEAWAELGELLLDRGQCAAAEGPLLQAFRIRKLTHDERIYFSYGSLAKLRTLQGDPDDAFFLFGKGIEAARAVNPWAAWKLYYERGKAEQRFENPQAAFEDFGTALHLVRAWRTEVLPSDVMRVANEVGLHQIYSDFVSVAIGLYERTGEERFARAAFASAEESRAASIRALWTGPDLTRKLPQEYWKVVADLQRAEAAVIEGEHFDAASLQRLRVRAQEMEIQAGLDLTGTSPVLDTDQSSILERTERALASTDTYFGFHIGESDSFLWAVTSRGFQLRRLPTREQLASDVNEFVKAIQENTPEVKSFGRKLYTEIFGSFGSEFTNKTRWILAPDGPLFDLPFAALVTGSPDNSAATYAIEEHSIEMVPSASAALHSSGFEFRGTFVGLADPIYNRADARFRGSTGQRDTTALHVPLELNRLVGSGREIENWARIWENRGHETVVLKGATATSKNLVQAIGHEGSVLHIATHVLVPPREDTQAAIALSLQPEGQLDLLSATEIAGIRARIGLVVLNGCGSGNGTVLPGAGLMGLTRAWLAAGAHAIVATRWEVADPRAGEFFQSFYRHFTISDRQPLRRLVAESLQQAQMDALHSTGVYATPAYWSGYFLVARD
ncbi:MAG: CHAT domain-containing protein [Acidobacteriia bacterium]|nr:CHAT domain-containing protein [Terriglobia bacterium]